MSQGKPSPHLKGISGQAEARAVVPKPELSGTTASRSGGRTGRGDSPWPPWLLPLFLGAHVAVTAVLIPILGVRDPLYRAIPWIFALAFVLSLIPSIGRRLSAGHPAWRFALVALYGAVITLASSVHPSATTGVSGNVFHPVEYAGLTFLGLVALHRGPWAPLRPRVLILVVLVCALLGALDELHQSFVPRRSATVEDVFLDTLGGVAGVLVFLLVVGFMRWQKRSPNALLPSGHQGEKP